MNKSEYNSEYYQKNKERAKALARKYYWEHRDECLARHKAWEQRLRESRGVTKRVRVERTPEEQRQHKAEVRRRQYQRRRDHFLEKSRLYRESHREEHRQRARDWAQQHPERVRANRRRLREQKGDLLNQRNREWAAQNRDHLAVVNHEWRHRNREYVLRQNRRKHQARKEVPGPRNGARWTAIEDAILLDPNRTLIEKCYMLGRSYGAAAGRLGSLRQGLKGNANSRKTHCPHGHLYDARNTQRTLSGERKCRACNKIRKQAKAARLKAGTP